MGLVIGSLVFWKARPGSRRSAPQLNEALQSGEDPADLEPLPVNAILKALRRQYPEMEWSDGFGEVDLDDVEAGVEVSWMKKHFHFDFYGNGFGQMDVVARLMAGFGCSCYFVGEKFAYSPEGLPRFSDPEEEARDEARIKEAVRHGKSVGGDPLEQLRAAVDHMFRAGDGKAPRPAKPAAKKPATKKQSPRKRPAKKQAKKRRG